MCIGVEMGDGPLKAKLFLLLLIAFQMGRLATAQSDSTISSSNDTDSAAQPQLQTTPDSASPTASQERMVSWKTIVPDLARDQRRVWSFPSVALRSKSRLPVLGVLAGTAALLMLDAKTAESVRGTNVFNGFNRGLSGRNTALATLAVPASLLGVGLIRRASYTQQTALLAGEAVADTEILTTVLKAVDRRLRPSDVPAHAGFTDTWFDQKLSSVGGNGSFPSGHTVAAFSVATVIAERYRTHRWVPYAAYAAAGLIGFSRISLQSHFSSDVFMGAALGYSITHFIVLGH
jgi:membrane-associated phospholipid phosphatase